jgi:23S rRNA pseudouridine2605 synthase
LGVASRREAEIWITEGRLAVNGKVVTAQGTKVDTESDSISLNGKLVKAKLPPKVYWLLNKPDKILTARSDELTNKPTIYDLPMVAKAKFLVSPVGRLDFRTEGLLLLTNDGDLNYKLCRPEYHVPREYQVLLDGRLTKEEEAEIKKGVVLEDGPTRDVKVVYVHGTNMGLSTGSWYMITVHEGRNRLVRRIFEHFEKRVVRLIRVGFGDIRLPADLPAGQYRQLTNAQVDTLRVATEHAISMNSSKRVSASKNRSARKALSFKPRVKKPLDEDEIITTSAAKSTVKKSTEASSALSKGADSRSKDSRATAKKPASKAGSTSRPGRKKSVSFKDAIANDKRNRHAPSKKTPASEDSSRKPSESGTSIKGQSKDSVDKKKPAPNSRGDKPTEQKSSSKKPGESTGDRHKNSSKMKDGKSSGRTSTSPASRSQNKLTMTKQPEKKRSTKRG